MKFIISLTVLYKNKPTNKEPQILIVMRSVRKT